jgi:hypothetical protein
MARLVRQPLTCWGALNLFVAGAALLALLFASYGGRGIWIACCSTAISVAALAGGLFLPTLEDRTEVRAGLNWVAAQFPVVLDQKSVNELMSIIRQDSTSLRCEEQVRPTCIVAADPHTSYDADVMRGASLWSAALQARASADAPEPKTDWDDVLRSPVIWLLDERRSALSSRIADGFFIRGINISDDALQDIRGTLKLDTGKPEPSLVLKLKGHEVEDQAVVPAGARFILGLEQQPKANRITHFSGAIFTFRYTYKGQPRASILYLNPSMAPPPRAAANSE